MGDLIAIAHILLVLAATTVPTILLVKLLETESPAPRGA
jgi:hypothetical protein